MGYDINEIYKGSSDHLKSEDIGNNMPTFTMAGIERKTFDNGDMKLILSFHETEKSLVLNATNARAIGDMYTPDTDNWLGKQIMLFTMPVEFNGQKTMGIRVRAPAPEQQPVQQPVTQQPSSGHNELNPPPSTGNDYANQSGGR